MGEIRKLQKLGGSKALTLPAGWLQMIEGDYGHEITEVEVQDNGPTLVVRPLFTHGYDALKYEVIEDAFGIRGLARPTINIHNAVWKELLDQVTRAGGRIVIDNVEYSLVHTDNDLGYGKTERVLIGISRQRLPRKA
jgi:antitoxin component of MazEF toxin-antitoxin module